MLVHLAIRNLAVIADTALDFEPGLNVLTGETGAGKSIIVGALNLVLGDRARSDAIRKGEDKAEVQALFRLRPGDPVAKRLVELDLLSDESPGGAVELLVRRIVSAAGKSRVYINGVLSTVGTLADVTAGLVDIASQHQHTQLLDGSRHLPLLDRYGDHDGIRARFVERFGALEQARDKRDALAEREQARVEREDFVRFQLGEIDEVNPTPGEDEELTQERERLLHAEKLTQGARETEQRLAGHQGSVGAQLQASVRTLDRLATVDAELSPYVERLETARIELEDVAFELARYAEQIASDPRRLERVEERLDALRRLKRKHGAELTDVLERAAALREELSAFESLELDVKEADAEVAKARAAALEAAEALSKKRRAAAKDLEGRISAELKGLAMTGAAVRFELERKELAADGVDAGELLIRTNAGDDFKPLARVASGGELSRLLLALKRSLTDVDPVRTAIFDEVDTGVGGAVAEVIGRKLVETAADRQVLAITHLPQIAAQARHHLVVEKAVGSEGLAETEVRILVPGERVDEIARMLGGVEITDRTRAHAEELLALGAAPRH